jgi:dihydroflavonol-4-reductase
LIIGVLGASGFIGLSLCQHLRSQGHDVRALTYHTNPPQGVSGFTWQRADVCSKSQLISAFKGLDVVINCAALFNHSGRSGAEYEHVNHTGALNVVEAARISAAQKVVHISTVGVALSGDIPYKETSAYHAPDWDIYEQSKMRGEQAVLSHFASTGFPVSVVRPAQVYGPRDLSKLKFFKLVQRGVVVAPGKTMKHLIYIDDLVRGIELSIENKSLEGRAVILANDAATPLSELISIAARQLQVTPPRIRVPQRTAQAGIFCIQKLFAMFGQEAPLTKRSLTFFTKSVMFDTTLALQVLDFKPAVSVEAGVGRTVAWYRDNGLL